MSDAVTTLDESRLKARQEQEAQALDEFRQTLLEEPQPLVRALGHMTGHSLELASRIGFAMQHELANRSDALAAFAESRILLGMFLQLQRQAERNQQLSAKLSATD